jgi:hypothetical protein
MDRAPIPPFNFDCALATVRMAEVAWNGRDPVNVKGGPGPSALVGSSACCVHSMHLEIPRLHPIWL